MTELFTIYGLLLVAPFLLGYIHQRQDQSTRAIVVYYRYFMFFNMIIAGLFVAAQVFMSAMQAGALFMWTYHTAFNLYGLAILSMVLMGAFTIFSRKKTMLAPAICWSLFLLLSTVPQITQITQHKVVNTDILMLQATDNLIVAVMMLGFLYLLKHYFREGLTESAVTANT